MLSIIVLTQMDGTIVRCSFGTNWPGKSKKKNDT